MDYNQIFFLDNGLPCTIAADEDAAQLIFGQSRVPVFVSDRALSEREWDRALATWDERDVFASNMAFFKAMPLF